MNKTWKQAAAGIVALALITGGTPANVAGFLTGNTGITASAAEGTPLSVGTTYLIGDTIIQNEDAWMILDDAPETE
ncbi:MAG: hypothetical protein K5695_10790 [Oscillospiraceae bacterium]|nr:hypothetical protein [Oscillospiraceae bacterium]